MIFKRRATAKAVAFLLWSGKLVFIGVFMSFSCHQRQEKNEKKRRSRGKDATKLGRELAIEKIKRGRVFASSPP